MNVETVKGIMIVTWMGLVTIGYYLKEVSHETHLICMAVMLTGIYLKQ